MPRLVAITLILFALAGCSRDDRPYTATTPDETLDSAQKMIVNGEADRLVELVYAEDDQTRAFLDQVGRLLGSVQELARAVEQRFPDELARFRAEAAQAAAGGNASPLLTRLVSAGRQRNREFGASQIDREGLTIDTGTEAAPRRPGFMQGPRTESERKLINDILKQLLADPYRWLAEGRDKLGVVYISDDTVSLTWEDRPVLPPFGLVLIQRGGDWCLVPPTSNPIVKKIMPRNDDEWFVWG
ncbi:MAG: hypothetical protein K8E66_14240, partial [Phycisphaerales bacterium]|nr:hypothetical protein [Phycisphaerales bacterium]